MRLFLILLFVLTQLASGFCQTSDEEQRTPKVMEGFLHQTYITPESYLITNEKELKVLVERMPPFTPYKALPRPQNPDPFLKDFKVDFEKNILVVAVGRDRIEDRPIFQGVERSGVDRVVSFSLPQRSAKTYPYGWAVYTAVILPRSDSETRVVVNEAPAIEAEDFPRAKFPRL